MRVLFEFRAHLFGARRSVPVVIKGSRAFVERYIPLSDFEELSGGDVLWRKAKPRTLDMTEEGIGVWGRRTVSKFRKVLRERGAEFRVIQG